MASRVPRSQSAMLSRMAVQDGSTLVRLRKQVRKRCAGGYKRYNGLMGLLRRRKPEETEEEEEEEQEVVRVVTEPYVAALAGLAERSESFCDGGTLVCSSRSSAHGSTLTLLEDDQAEAGPGPGPAWDVKLRTLSEDQELLEVRVAVRRFNQAHASELGRQRHLHYYQLPFPWRENRFIIHGYRFYDSHYKSLLSVVNWYGWHNETANIWTHLAGAAYVVWLAAREFPRSAVWQSERVPPAAKWIVYVFLAAALKCMLASVFWHTFNGTCCLALRSRFACVDYSGITLLISASILTTEFVTMYEYPWSLRCYLAVSAVLGVVGVVMNWSPRFDRPEARPLRIKFFVLLAAMGALSFVQLGVLGGWGYAVWLMAPVTRKSLGWYLVGVVFYGTFVPERFRTDVVVDRAIPTEQELSAGLAVVTTQRHVHFRAQPTAGARKKDVWSLWWVDYVGCSHSWWHLFVVLGVVGHYHAIVEMFAKRWGVETM